MVERESVDIAGYPTYDPQDQQVIDFPELVEIYRALKAAFTFLSAHDSMKAALEGNYENPYSPLTQQVQRAAQLAERAASGIPKPKPTPSEFSADTEVLPYIGDTPPEGRIDLTTSTESWVCRSKRTVIRDMGEGRYALVWGKGARIPDQEAVRQGIDPAEVRAAIAKKEAELAEREAQLAREAAARGAV
jgi:hypothetical protein